MITDNYLILQRPHIAFPRYVQRIYRFASGKGLSLVNPPDLHGYSFAWEAAVIKDVTVDGHFSELDYTTSLTDDVVVLASDEEANEFIERAARTI